VASLGIDAIWISPFFKSPMRDFGYDVSDYRGVDPIFGSNADFNAGVEAAHERGLKVIIDMVLAHTSDQHAWFQESRQNRTNSKADWYVWADPKPDGTPLNNWISVFGGSAWQKQALGVRWSPGASTCIPSEPGLGLQGCRMGSPARKGELSLRGTDRPRKVGPHDVKIEIHAVGVCGNDVHLVYS